MCFTYMCHFWVLALPAPSPHSQNGPAVTFWIGDFLGPCPALQPHSGDSVAISGTSYLHVLSLCKPHHGVTCCPQVLQPVQGAKGQQPLFLGCRELQGATEGYMQSRVCWRQWDHFLHGGSGERLPLNFSLHPFLP